MNVTEETTCAYDCSALNPESDSHVLYLNRRVVVWMDSVPSPGKSKIVFEIKVRK